MRRGTWTETGGSGGGGVGLLIAAVFVGALLAIQAKPHAPAVEPAAPAVAEPLPVAVQAAHHGHGFAWWALVTVGLCAAVVVLIVVVAALLERATRRRSGNQTVDNPVLDPAVDDPSIVRLSDYAEGRRNAAGGGGR